MAEISWNQQRCRAESVRTFGVQRDADSFFRQSKQAFIRFATGSPLRFWIVVTLLFSMLVEVAGISSCSLHVESSRRRRPHNQIWDPNFVSKTAYDCEQRVSPRSRRDTRGRGSITKSTAPERRSVGWLAPLNDAAANMEQGADTQMDSQARAQFSKHVDARNEH